MPKYRVPFSRGRPHVIFYIDILRQTCTPGAVRRSHQDAADWGHQFSGRAAIVVCQRGQKLSEGTAAWLRHVDVPAEALEGGFEGWKAAKLSLVPTSKLPARDARGRTVWVTRARPKIDRIACP
jgi:rhodanese-related sulfurtransferase